MRQELTEQQKQACRDFLQNPVAGGLTWQDATSYSRSDTEKVPTVLKAQAGTFQISIVLGHTYYPTTWIFSCPALGFGTAIAVGAQTPAEAALLAVKACKSRAQSYWEAFQNL